MKNSLISGIILSILLFASCEKSEEEFINGGLVEEAEVNILNSWSLMKYLREGNDETSLIHISQYSEEYSGTDTYSRTYTNADLEVVSESGRFVFSDDNLSLNISDVSSIQEFSEDHSTVSSATYNILKLTATEFRYQFENGGDSHEFRFTAQ